MGASGWLRSNAEHYLREAAEIEMSRRDLKRGGPVGPEQPGAAFWRQVFVPAYRLLPWRARNLMMRAMPGSHQRRWRRRASPS